MTQEAKALLDELMGRTRNLDPTQSHQDVTWQSDEVCKYFLCAFCPNELFTNTRADLGPCNKIHDDAFRKEYQSSPRFEKCGFEEDFVRFMQTLISDVEKRIRRGHQRLALNNQTGNVNGSTNTQHEDKIELLTEKINDLVDQAEKLGCEGKVEEAQGMMKLADQLKEERTQLEKPVQDDIPMMKQMEVCDVCGAFLIVGDAPQRQDEHLMGKQHAGYAQVRAELEKRKKKAKDVIDAREANELKMKQEREDREKERLREREERRQKERDRERDRLKERDRRRRSRSRSRDRQRGSRRRSSSRDRRRGRKSRSRSRDRRRRSNSRNGRQKRSSSQDRKSSRRRSSSQDKKSSRRRSRERRSRSSHKSPDSRDKRDKGSRDKDDKRNEDRRSSKETETKDNTEMEAQKDVTGGDSERGASASDPQVGSPSGGGGGTAGQPEPSQDNTNNGSVQSEGDSRISL